MTKKSVYDTRFFIEYFYSGNSEILRKLKEDLRAVKERMVSTITVHEVYRIDLEKEGREVAVLRSNIIRRDFTVVHVDYDVAVKSAELRSKHDMPLADSLIAATAQIQRCPLVSDDLHFKQIEKLEVRWDA